MGTTENQIQTADLQRIAVPLAASQTAPAVLRSQGLALTLTNDREGRKQLAEIVAQCFDGLKLYGREPEQLANAVKLFDLALGAFSVEQVRAGFVAHLQRSSEMPTPADIVGYIRRKGRPPLDKAMYTALIQKRERTSFVDAGQHGNGLTTAEEKYIQEYEEYALNG